jgi:DNA invertase Pin-like site-specific DNA recombinase
MQHTFGYAHVSATNQNLDTQLDDLTRAGYMRIFQEKVSGTRI